MATLIPYDAVSAMGEADRLVGTCLVEGCPEDLLVWHADGIEGRPTFVLLCEASGLLLLEVFPWSFVDIESVDFGGVRLSDGSTVDPLQRAGATRERVRLELEGILTGAQVRVAFALPLLSDAQVAELGLAAYFGGVSAVALKGGTPEAVADALARGSKGLEADVVSRVREVLYPDTSFVLPRRVEDKGKDDRERARILLDAKQEAIARSLGSGVTVLTGVAGSGKTIVLIARARLLAAAHPDWRIQVLCFNKTLKAYLRTLVGRDYPNVDVNYVTAWRYKQGVSSDDALRRACGKGIPPERYDAILVDEVQDFQTLELCYLRRCVRRGRGGLMLAGDLAQAIYDAGDVLGAFEGVEIETVDLSVNYRNTEQISTFAWGSVFGTNGSGAQVLAGRDACDVRCTMSGPKVQLVWAGSQAVQAQAIACEIRRLRDEEEFRLGEIGVLHTNWHLGRLLSIELERARLPVWWITQDKRTRSMPCLIEDSVKVVTVHSCKGLEFPCIFLAGVESLKVPETYDEDDPDDMRRLKLAYVGMTRAKDRLYVAYSRTNAVISRALELESWAEVRTYPDDFE